MCILDIFQRTRTVVSTPEFRIVHSERRERVRFSMDIKKCGTHVRVLSTTLVHGHSMNEIRREYCRSNAGKSENGEKQRRHEIKRSNCVNNIIIIVRFCQATLRPKRSRSAIKEGTIQYGCRKWGTDARVFSQTLVDGNRKNEIRQIDRRRR